MKWLVFYLGCVSMTLSVGADLRKKVPAEIMELIENLHVVCREQTGVEDAVVEKIHGGVFEEDMKLKCYFKCMMMQLQAMNDDGELEVGHIEDNLPEDMVKHGAMDVVNKCKEISHDDKCEKAFLLIKCFHSANEELSQMFE